MGNILFLTNVDRSALVSEMKKYISDEMINCKIIVLSDNKYLASQRLADEFVLLPQRSDNILPLDFLKQVIFEKNIVGFFVASNFDIELILQIEEWLKYNDVIYFAPTRNSLENCLSKKRVFDLLFQNQIHTPHMYTNSKTIKFPAVIKPDIGHRTQDVFILNTDKERRFYSKRIKKPVIQEYIDGKHYTVDCFNDMNRQLRVCVPRRRLVVEGANSVVSGTVDNQEIKELAHLISSKISITGPWNFQVIEATGKYFTHDINPRAAAGLIYSIMSGIPFQKYIVDTLLGINIDNWDYTINGNSIFSMYRNYVMI
jgi:carbamoylphosphate synthase large subunit